MIFLKTALSAVGELKPNYPKFQQIDAINAKNDQDMIHVPNP